MNFAPTTLVPSVADDMGGSPMQSPRACATMITDDITTRAKCEQDLAAARIPLPLPHTLAWASAFPTHANHFLALRDDRDTCIGGFALHIHKSRALPGHLLLRAERVGPSIAPEYFGQAAERLVRLCRENSRILRLNVELFGRDEQARAAMAQALAAAGFTKVEPMKNYPFTIALDLTSSEDQILASLHGTARRHIRAIAKHPLELRAITDVALCERLTQLTSETQSRTGGDYTQPHWPSAIKLSVDHPTRSRLIGIFRTDATGPQSLLAFAWSHHHGDHAHYDASASTRDTDIKAPLAYALIWDLCLWARQNGATWFDFGGITQTSHSSGDGDALGGISDFKRYFSKTVVSVGEEWMLEPRPLRAKLARSVSRAISYVSGLRS